MKKQKIGKSPIESSRLAYGCMRLAGTWNPGEIDEAKRKKAREAVQTAYEAGYRLFDHADIYCRGGCEELFGDILQDMGPLDDPILIATKCGIRTKDNPEGAPYRYDSSAKHILTSVEDSLRRLRVDRIDLYMIHRWDFATPTTEIAAAFQQLLVQGKVRTFGVSNFSASQVRTLQKACSMPLVANQVEIHPGRLAPFTDGVLDQCLADKITPLAWSPVHGGRLVEGREPDNDWERNLFEVLDRLGEEYGVARSTMIYAWLLRHPSQIIPIVGSTNPDRIREAARADSLELSHEHWYEIFTAATGSHLA